MVPEFQTRPVPIRDDRAGSTKGSSNQGERSIDRTDPFVRTERDLYKFFTDVVLKILGTRGLNDNLNRNKDISFIQAILMLNDRLSG